MMITKLNGFGCAGDMSCGCNKDMPPADERAALAMNFRRALYGGSNWIPRLQGLRGLGEVKDYDQIKIGGNTYSVNQIIGKTVVAKVDTPIYFGTRTASQKLTTIKSGQTIGVVFSYIQPSKSSDGNSWLQFDGITASSTGFGFARNENISEGDLKDSGALTVQQELKKEADEKLRQDNPALYYAKKLALPAALVVGAIIIGKAAVTAYINKPKSSSGSPASSSSVPVAGLSGIKKRRRKKRK